MIRDAIPRAGIKPGGPDWFVPVESVSWLSLLIEFQTGTR